MTKRHKLIALLLAIFIIGATPQALAQDGVSNDYSEPPSENQSLDNLAPQVMQGYIFQTMTTPESYLIANGEELKAFVATLPPYTPYKVLPAPVNNDPFLHGFSPDFENEVLVIAVGHDRITNNPIFMGLANSSQGEREVNFGLTAKTLEPYPYGWAVYSALILPRIQGPTSIKILSLPANPAPKLHKNSHPGRSFLDRAKKF